eukprot:1196215-Prorocentrum_minimum.AAC.14
MQSTLRTSNMYMMCTTTQLALSPSVLFAHCVFSLRQCRRLMFHVENLNPRLVIGVTALPIAIVKLVTPVVPVVSAAGGNIQECLSSLHP